VIDEPCAVAVAVPPKLGVDCGRPRKGVLQFLKHEHAGPFAEDEAIAVAVERTTGVRRVVVALQALAAAIGPAGDVLYVPLRVTVRSAEGDEALRARVVVGIAERFTKLRRRQDIGSLGLATRERCQSGLHPGDRRREHASRISSYLEPQFGCPFLRRWLPRRRNSP